MLGLRKPRRPQSEKSVTQEGLKPATSRKVESFNMKLG